jgi:type II secretory pathway pseudopilin PulG
MIMREKGFTLIELLIATTIFIIAIAAIARLFITTAGQFKQQSKMTETYIEGMIGLEQLRLDIGHAGYGLPWNLDSNGDGTNDADYSEAVDNGSTNQNETAYNDSAADVPPRAFVSGDGNGLNGTDVLVIKAVNIAMNDASQKSTTLQAGDIKRVWGISSEDLAANERIIIIDPGSTDATSRTLRITGTYPTPSGGIDINSTSGYAPTSDAVKATYIIYGVDPGTNNTNIRMPFNRADYYINTTGTMPAGCAAGTGIFYKATVNQSDGALNPLPLLDCVADFQVVYGLDNDENGELDAYSNDLVGAGILDAKQTRDRVKEVRIYILAHEGQRDTRYTFDEFTGAVTCATCIRVGMQAVLGRDFDIQGIANYLNYRWKVYTLIVKPTNLK